MPWFIKSGNTKTTAVLLTFNLFEALYNTYIPAEAVVTAKNKYQDQPMICHQ